MGVKQATLISLFQQFPRILILPVLCRIVVNLHGKFIQNAKGENPKPMAVEGNANEEAQQPPPPLERLRFRDVAAALVELGI